MPPPPDVATIHALRSDLALQISRVMRHRGLNQLTAAKQFGVPQPTLSKIANGRVADLSLDLLIRIPVRAGLPVVLQTGQVSEVSVVFVSCEPMPLLPRTASGLAVVVAALLAY